MKPPASSKGLTVDVTSGTKAFAVAELLRETAPGKPCAFVAGDVPPDVAVAPVRLRTGSGVVDGGLVCGDGVEGMLRHPTVHDGVMTGFARGELRAVHGSDTSDSAPLSELVMLGPQRAVLVYAAQPGSSDDATKLVDSVRPLLRPRVVFVWLVSD